MAEKIFLERYNEVKSQFQNVITQNEELGWSLNKSHLLNDKTISNNDRSSPPQEMVK